MILEPTPEQVHQSTVACVCILVVGLGFVGTILYYAYQHAPR